MRTFEEINADIGQAYRNQDTEALCRLADEMRAVATPESESAADRAQAGALAIDGKYREALTLFRTCLSLAADRGDMRTVGLSAIGIGNVHKDLGEYADALISYERSRAIFKSLSDTTNYAIAVGGIGTVYTYQGLFDEALKALQEAVQLYESVGDQSRAAGILRAIGVVMHDKGDYRSALEYYERSLRLHELKGEHLRAAACLGEIGNTYIDLSDHAMATEYLRRALSVYEQHHNKPGIASVLAQLGSVFFVVDDYVAAMDHYQRALAYAQEMGAQSFVATLLSNIGNVHARTGNLDTAAEITLRALEMDEMLGNQAGVARLNGNLGSIYAMRREWDRALSYLQTSLEQSAALNIRGGSAMMEGNLINTLLQAERYEDAVDRFSSYADQVIIEPEIIAAREEIRARIAEHRGDLETAQAALLTALDMAHQHGLRQSQASIYQALRDLAQKRDDFAGYIKYNQEYQRLTEEITGKETLRRLAVQETERRLEKERLVNEKHIAVLHSALPPSIADRLVRGERVEGDHFDNAAVVFLDIVGFTTHTSHMPPAEVVKMLENIFRTIDGFCATHNVVKVKTIGDSYMCFRGDADALTNALSIARVALDVMQATFVWPHGDRIQFRVGADAGPVTAGVIGTERLQYDLWGDTVNVASRMESTSEPGKIHISEAFAMLLPATYAGDSAERPLQVLERGTMDIKGKGSMTTFWLEGA